MRAEVISIGDELVSGVRLDTNTQWLSRQLGDFGIATIRQTTVGDDLEGNVEAFQLAAARADIVVCTGGLGPTLDDLTRQALALAFERELVLDQASLDHIQRLFAGRARPMPESNRLQAMFPRGAQSIPNPQGSAPGIDLEIAGEKHTCRIFALPGVPAEMKQMWEVVADRLHAMFSSSRGRLRYRSIKVFGIGESDVEVLLPQLIDRRRQPTVGITVSRATITLRIAARANTEEEFQAMIQSTVDEIHQGLGDLVFGEEEDELEDVVLRLLERRQLSLATLEFGASSLVGDWLLRRAAGATQLYQGSLAFPSLAQACHWMTGGQTTPPTADPTASVQNEDALYQHLAQQARQRFQSDIVLVLGPYPQLAEMERASTAFPLVWAIADRDAVNLQRRSIGGHPDVLPARIAKTGLDLLRKHLTN